MKPKPFNSSSARKALDRIWSALVKRRDGHKCQKCGVPRAWEGHLHSAHIFGRKLMAVRWSLLNGVTLCWKCHGEWAHREVKEFQTWALARLTPEERDYLIAESRKIVQFGPMFYESALQVLRAEENARWMPAK